MPTLQIYLFACRCKSFRQILHNLICLFVELLHLRRFRDFIRIAFISGEEILTNMESYTIFVRIEYRTGHKFNHKIQSDLIYPFTGKLVFIK